MNKHNVDTQDSTKTEEIVSKLDELIAAVLNTKKVTTIDSQYLLWNTNDVADYLKVSYKYASEYIVTHHTFPHAIRVPTKNGRNGHPRWYATDVITWTSKYRDS